MEVDSVAISGILKMLLYLGAFGIVALASGRIAGVFAKLKLPEITGFLLIGLLSGPEVLGLIDSEALPKLNFLNNIALAFIAFAVGSELFLKNLRSRIKSIFSLIISQSIILFILVGLTTYLISDLIPFLEGLTMATKIAISILTGTIAIATSPAASIAIIDELRARGPFTQTSLGVIVVKDFVVIILFSVVFTLSKSLILDAEFSLLFIGQLLAELVLAFGLGFMIWYMIRIILSLKGVMRLKKLLILTSGFLAYLVANIISTKSLEYIGFELHVEPLLTCILASFLVTNYSIYRNDFMKILKELAPYVYVVFFTLTGARISVEVVASLWYITLILFGVRIVSLMLAGAAGSKIAGDPPLFLKISWMPYVTQAGISLGLATIIATAFPDWGGQFATILISMIVLNEVVGPPSF